MDAVADELEAYDEAPEKDGAGAGGEEDEEGDEGSEDEVVDEVEGLGASVSHVEAVEEDFED